MSVYYAILQSNHCRMWCGGYHSTSQQSPISTTVWRPLFLYIQPLVGSRVHALNHFLCRKLVCATHSLMVQLCVLDYTIFVKFYLVQFDKFHTIQAPFCRPVWKGFRRATLVHCWCCCVCTMVSLSPSMVWKDLPQLATCGESRVNAIIQRYTRTCIRDPGDT